VFRSDQVTSEAGIGKVILLVELELEFDSVIGIDPAKI
jgi:hypothetical protein